MTELAVGVYALRTFRVDLAGQLLPVSAHRHYRGATAWERGRCVATCLAYPGSTHQVPDEHCDCGIYGFADAATLRKQYRQAHGIIAVIALEGAVLEGEDGYRAQAARVVALWTSPALIDATLQGRIEAGLGADVVFYDDLDAMVAEHPGLRHTSPSTGTTRAVGPGDLLVTSSLPRRQLAKALATTAKWWLRVALWVIGFCWWPVWNHFATSSGFDLSAYPVVDAIMAIPRWAHRFAVTLGSPGAMWLGLLPVAVVAGLYVAPAARGVASRLLAPAEGMVQVLVSAVIAALPLASFTAATSDFPLPSNFCGPLASLRSSVSKWHETLA